MTIVDNGRGFRREQGLMPGMGLRSMRYRAYLIGAELVVESNLNKGTEVRCTLAYSHAHHS